MGTPMETTFVGRHVEIAQVTRLMRESRLVTLTGLGGVGKSRLAHRVVEESVAEFPDGLWLVELACLTDPHLLPETVADVMGLADQPARRRAEVLAEWLGPRRSLLVLDTCEHLVEAVASLVDTLLRAAPRLRVLVTGRQPLGAPGEHVYSVPPLPVEDAVALLRERAGLVAPPDGSGGEGGAAELAELCQGLDRIPLAIELAAVQLRTLPPTVLLRRLNDRYHLLTGDGGPVRHGSLRAAMGWSHELCAPAERLLWARLSVFASGFDLEAAEYVCAGGPLPAGQVLEALTGLADKSLLQREEHPTGVRLRMLDTVREFGAEWLSRLGEDSAVRGRHRDHYLRLARRCATEWPGRQVEWYGRIRAERRNLRKVFELCLADPQWSRAGLDLAGTLWFLWVCCGMSREGRHHLETALRADPGPSPERLRALWVCAWVAALQGDLAAARERLDQCRAEDPEGSVTGHVLQVEGMLSLLRRDHARAVELLEEAMAWHMAKGGVLSGLLPCHTLAALGLLAAGRPAEAVETLSEGQALCEVHGEEWSRAQMEYVFAWAGHVEGEASGALRHARSALASALGFEDLSLSAACVEMIAWAVTEEGDAGGGAWLLGAAQAVRDSLGLPRSGSGIFAPVREQTLTQAVKVLGGAGFDTLFTEGKGSDLGIAVKYALGEKIS